MFEVQGQTFKMIILTYIFLYSGVFLRLKPTKPGEKKTPIHFLILFSVNHHSIQANKSLRKPFSFFFSFGCLYFSQLPRDRGKRMEYKVLHSQSIQIRIQPVKSSKLLFRLKAEKETSKKPACHFFSIQLLCFHERLYIIRGTEQSLFRFFFINNERLFGITWKLLLEIYS